MNLAMWTEGSSLGTINLSLHAPPRKTKKMPRIARLMLADYPFHLAHRGNQQRKTFLERGDYLGYLDLLRRYSEQFDMLIWAYCLMPNHVHILAVGKQRNSIPRAIGNTQREYSRRSNRRRQTTGHLWANRYFSTILDEPHLWAAVKYVELNPARGRLVTNATDYEWSSARAHAGLVRSDLLDPERPFPGPIGDWRGWLATGLDDETVQRLQENTYSGAPSGSREFVSELEQRVGRGLRPQKPGARPKADQR
jgi:putative transposase